MIPRLILKAGREKSLLRRHPWVFSGAVQQVEGAPAAGDTLALTSDSGQFLAWGLYNPNSQIVSRVWSWQESEPPDADLLRRRLSSALAARQALLPDIYQAADGALRLAHAESDGLPGFILDRYADTLVAQFLTAGAERWRSVLTSLALELTGCERLYERSDVDARRLEGLPLQTGLLAGSEPPAEIVVREGSLLLGVNVRSGHKTGFYLDQRTARASVQAHAAGRQVLDCFCYTGGFSLAALTGGAASVLAIDASADALAQARQNVLRNKLPTQAITWREGDVFRVLRELRDRAQEYDLIILDPPKFAQSASQVERAARGYKDINLLAFKLLRPGGLLFTFSCSGGVDADLFQKIVAGAALDAGADAAIIERLAQGADHPVALNFPEGAYLKGLVLRKTT